MAWRRRAGDRRGGVRFEIVGQLWGWLSMTEPLHVYNISRGGALVEARRPLLPDSRHEIRVIFEGQVSRLQVRVCHMTPVTGEGTPQDARRYRIGCEFVDINQPVLEQIDRIVAASGAGLQATVVVRSMEGGCMPDGVEERRRTARATLGGPLDASLLVSMPARLVEIGPGGVLLQSEGAVVGPGAEAEIRAFLCGGVFSACLRIIRAGGAGSATAVGAAFVRMDGESQRLMQRFLQQPRPVVSEEDGDEQKHQR